MDDARPKMCFCPSPPPPTPKTIFSSNLTFGYKCSSDHISVPNTNYYCQDYNNNNITVTKEQDNMQRPEDLKNVKYFETEEETTSDYKQWLHAMKLVARLPGGIPPEFRRKLWLSLADKYLKSKNIDWDKEEEKCFCEKWREDDEELGIQIVKDLHRTGSTLCTGPAGDINQAKLKRILLGYARYNPEVGYCQGFNMLGALILQVMDKDESESIKVMIYLVEGILPTGYFCGSMGGLQADMAVFRELMQTKLPRLAKHLQKLQGPVENAYEPPLTNVFTMQWFLTMFCTCLPMSCVLRVWDLVLIEGSDVLLRTALALWSLLEERVLSARSADDFYGKMGSFSSELLNGHLIDSNGLIEKIVQLGPIADIQKLRDKHLYNIAPIESQQGLQLYFDEDEPDIDEDSRLVVATVWGIPWGRRGSQGQPNTNVSKQAIENKERIALDISLLKKQYDRLRERQKQAQIILTTACSTASRQSTALVPLPVNQLLPGRPAIVTNKGRRSGPLTGAIPPARKPSLPAVLHEKPLEKQLKRGETLHWRDMKDMRPRRDSLSWKEIKAERAAMITSESIDELKSQKIRSGRLAKSDSSSYSEESDDNKAEKGEDASSTETSLCDDDLQPITNDVKHRLHIENSHKCSGKPLHRTKKCTHKQRNKTGNSKDIGEKTRPKSWAPSSTDIPFVLMTSDSPSNSADENLELAKIAATEKNKFPAGNDKLTEKAQTNLIEEENLKFEQENIPFLGTTTPIGSTNDKDSITKTFDISNEGVTNEYFERVNSTERPTKLDLLYSLNEDENIRDESCKTNEESRSLAKYRSLHNSNNVRCMDLLVDYSEKSSVACIEEAKSEISTTFQSFDASAAISLPEEHLGFTNENLFKKAKGIGEKRRNPRRLTLTRSSTMDIEKRFEALEKRLSMDVCSSFKRFSGEIEFNEDMNKKLEQSNYVKLNKSSTAFNHPYDHTIDHKTLLTECISSQDKKIPSTADLEERFANIQQQLVRDRNKMMPSDSENSEKLPSLNTSSDNNILKSPKDDNPSKQGKKHNDNEGIEKVEEEKILSAHSEIEEKSSESTEFEDVNRVNTIKDTQSTLRQDSASTKSAKIKPLKSKKEPPDEGDNENVAEKNHTNERSINEIEKNANKKSNNSGETEVNTKRDTRKSNSEMTQERRSSDRTSPPSTEELEKRFCALEEQMSSVKNDSNEAGPNLQCKKQHKSEEASGKTRTDSSQTELDNKFEHPSEKTTKRRLSEPPSTEDLEKRYEIMKRRMSSRNFETKSLHKDVLFVSPEKTKKSTSHTNKADISTNSNKRSPPSIENLEERFEKLQNKSESKTAITTPSPPSTKNLEERFEKLQNQNESKEALITHTPPSNQNPEDDFEKPQSKFDQIKTKKSEIDKINVASPVESDQMLNENNAESASDSGSKIEHGNSLTDSTACNAKSSNDIATSVTQEEVEDVSAKTKTTNVLAKNANAIKLKLIEELQAKIKENSINAELDTIVKKKTALVEELKAKTGPLQNTFLKPTQISCRRGRSPISQSTLLPSLSFNDETLESHAASAYRKSGKYEPTNSAKRKMVRRFSDLPSRADLENRLHFLEEQLSKTVGMQRRSSDSEVASKARFTHKANLSNVPISGSLEYRVQELEKRLNDNRTFSMDVDCSNANEKNGISQLELVTDTAAATGKELVRYSSHGEVGDFDHQNPINISINIQMTLNKDDVDSKKIADISKADDLDRRLHLLEQQLKITQMDDVCKIVAKECTRGKDPEVNVSVMENTNEDEKINDKIGEKVDVKISNKTETEINHSISENFQTVNNTEKLIQSEENSLSDKIDIPCQLSETNQQIENCKSEEPDVSDNSKENSNSQIQPTFSKKEQKFENNTDGNEGKEHKIIDQMKSEDYLKIEDSSIESSQSSIKEIKNQANFSQQKSQESETIDSQEHSKIQPNKIAEPEICKRDDSESINENVDNAEAKIKSDAEKFIVPSKCSQIVPVEVNKKTLVLLLDNEPKSVKVRRLTRANTEELEGLFQALEKQLNDREQQKSAEMKTNIALEEKRQNEIETSQTISNLTREIAEFSKTESNKIELNDKPIKAKQVKQEEEFDWGTDPIKYHLKKRTVYLPSTKELEARFRSLERQIRLLEDVEKIDVEQRLIEIERKIKLQYSLSHEKDLNKFLELCEGKDVDAMPTSMENYPDRKENSNEVQFDQICSTSRHTSPNRLKEPIPSNSSLELHYHSRDLKKTKSKQIIKKQPIHPLEMLLDPSPDDNDIPTTGELEHRIRVMEENRRSPSPSTRKSRSQSPHIKQTNTKPNIHILEDLTASPTERGLPTAEELEARLEALEKEQCFNFKMQKNFQQFNQKLKDVISPSISSDELKSSTKPCDSGHIKTQSFSASKQTNRVNTISPKSIRFCEEEQSRPQRELESKKTLLDDKGTRQIAKVLEGPGVMGIRLMRETSPLRRKGTHTGVPLRTGENINDQLTSIQNTIKSIDSLCEEKPYRKERCQQYIDSLFSDSTHFAHKKASLEDLTSHNLIRTTSREIGPSIRISGQSPPFTRSMGSADSIHPSSPLRSTSPLQYRSNRDLRREPSPRHRRDEDREEYESRVRRDNLLPNNINFSHSILSHTSHRNLTEFHKVDSQLTQLTPNDVERENEESLRQPTFSTVDSFIYHDNTNTSDNVNKISQRTSNAKLINPDLLKRQTLARPILPLCQTTPPILNTPVYTPAKLEIRHTTVTSTFYDRVLTEKQLEKQHHQPFPTNNHSPMISPLLEKQQQITKSPTNLSNTETINTLPLTDASTGNFHS